MKEDSKLGVVMGTHLLELDLALTHGMEIGFTYFGPINF